ncbi:hypothetical protein BWP19_16320, partial [Stenotrophomonas maltophilia]
MLKPRRISVFMQRKRGGNRTSLLSVELRMHRYPALPTRRATVLGSALVALLGIAAAPQAHA